MRITLLTIFFVLFLPIKTQGSSFSYLSTTCNSFDAGEIDAFKTLEALDIEIDDYSIGINNTVKIFCS